MLLKAYDEVRRAPDPAAAVEMVLIRLAYAADLPGPEEALAAIRSGEPLPGGAGPRPSGGGSGGGGGGVNARAQAFQSAPAPNSAPRMEARPQPTLQSFEDVVRLIEERRDIGLMLDVQRYVRPISFRPGAITFEPAAGAPANLAQRLVGKLKEWTGAPWLVAAEGSGGAETLLERERRETAKAKEDALNEPFVRAVMQAFPGTSLVEVRQLAAPEAAAPSDDEPDDDDD
jgi:DNA polymerase-3 subunit gamma/tau